MKALNTHSDVEKIVTYLQSGDNDVILSEPLQKILKRYRFCADLIKQHGSRLKVVPMLIREFGISEAQAYRDFQDTTYVFGSTPRSSKDFYLDMLLGNIVETRNKAIAKEDFKSAASCDKNMLVAIQEYFKDQSIPWDKVQPPNLTFGFFPELTNVNIPDNWQVIITNIINTKRSVNTSGIPEAEIVKDDTSSGE